jgi:hypothetical protein
MPVARRRDHGLFREAEENLLGARKGARRAHNTANAPCGLLTRDGAQGDRDATMRERAQRRVRSKIELEFFDREGNRGNYAFKRGKANRGTLSCGTIRLFIH